MDSITQIVLGASMGEIALGKKIGNKAMLWGGIAGTIPDLDVLSSFFLSEIQSLAYHRGLSHSILFSVVGAIVFGWLVHNMYKSQHYKWISGCIKSILLIGFFLFLNLGVRNRFTGDFTILAIISIVLLGISLFRVWKWTTNNIQTKTNTTLKDWVLLFFLALFTHPLLDCFTSYGTQLFAPFSYYRVSIASISVADPVYTVPFIICLLLVSFQRRESRKRQFFNYLGLSLSCIYLLVTVVNKQLITKTFKTALEAQNIEYSELCTTPTIFNNILWSCVAKSGDAYYQGTYSHFDTEPISFYPIEANHELINTKDPTIEVLDWFSNGYYNVIPLSKDKIQINDLRFGTFSGNTSGKDDFVFRFILSKLPSGFYELLATQGGPPEGKESELFKTLPSRILGNK